MTDRLVTWASALHRWYSTWQDRPASRLLRIGLALAVLAICGWFIWRQAFRGYTAISMADLSLEPSRLAVSWLCITAATALGAWEWVLLVRALGADLDTVGGMSVHLTSNLGKYVPGLVWPYAGKAYLASRRGVPLRLAGASIGAEVAIVYVSGGLLALLCLPFSGLLPWPLGGRFALQAGAIALTTLTILAIPALARGSRFRETPEAGRGQGRPVDWHRVRLVLALVLLTWCLLTLGFSTLYGPLGPNPGEALLRHGFALAAALLLGQVAFFLPTGLGVREAVFVALLSTTDSASLVVILAVVFRLMMLVGEVLCAAFMAAWDRLRRHQRAEMEG